MSPPTPQELAAHYRRLSADDQKTFIGLLGEMASDETPLLIWDRLPLIQRKRFSDHIGNQVYIHVLPDVIRLGWQYARDHPEGSNEEAERWVAETYQRETEERAAELASLTEAETLHRRGRKSDPATVKRNIEILDLRCKDKKLWTHGKLARQFDVTRQYVGEVIRGEAYWRGLASDASN